MFITNYNPHVYEHMKAFDWTSCEGKSYARINCEINKDNRVFDTLSEKITIPQLVMAGGLFAASIFAVILFCPTPDYMKSFHVPYLSSVIAVSVLAAVIASIVLMSRHYNKLTQQEIKKLKQKFEHELQRKVAIAERTIKSLERQMEHSEAIARTELDMWGNETKWYYQFVRDFSREKELDACT